MIMFLNTSVQLSPFSMLLPLSIHKEKIGSPNYNSDDNEDDNNLLTLKILNQFFKGYIIQNLQTEL